MDYYVIVYTIILSIIGIWTIPATPSRSILSKYPYFNLVLGVFLPSALSKINIDRRDLESINKFNFRYRIFCLFMLGGFVFFVATSTYTANRRLKEVQNTIEKAEKHLENPTKTNRDECDTLDK
jgi:hypothetical protein